MTLTKETLAGRIRAAREHSGLTQEEVARNLGVPRNAVTNIESGARQITSLELVQLAKLFRVPLEDIVEGRAGEEELTTLFRGNQSLATPAFEAAVREVIRICRLAADIDRALTPLEAARTRKHQTYNVPTLRTAAARQGEELAVQERERLHLGNGPIDRIGRLLFEEGIAVAKHDLPEGISGIFINSVSARPFALISNAESVERQRFSLAHEYCHALVDSRERVVISRDADHSARERRANAFASHFLMPATGILEALAHLGVKPGEFNFTHVAKLAADFQVSYPAMLIRLETMRVISPSQRLEFESRAHQARGYRSARLRSAEDLGDRTRLREMTYARALRAYQHSLMSRKKVISLSRELGMVDDLVLQALEALDEDLPPEDLG